MTRRNKQEIRTPYDAIRFFSALTHGIGFWLASGGTAVLIVLAALVGNTWEIVSFSVYGAALVGLYASSTLYHCLKVKPDNRYALRTLDHIMIYFLIAGTYTPICLVTLRQTGAWGWTLFGIIWGLAIAGTVIKIFWNAPPRWVSAASYAGMGWLVIGAMIPLVDVMEFTGLVFLFTGGGFYTIGGLLYALRWPGRDCKRFGFHEVFHIFVLMGSICHFGMMICILNIS